MNFDVKVGRMSNELKAKVGRAVLDYVQDGMKLGIGTGSTAEAFIHELGGAVANGLNVIGVPTSERTAKLCAKLNIPLTTLEETPHLDLTVDGADNEMLVIADESKLVETLGAFDLPIEVNQFGLAATTLAIADAAQSCGISGNLKLRSAESGAPFLTDGDHLILDASFGRITNPEALGRALVTVPGVVDHGLFTGLASKAIIAGSDGIRTVTAK